MAQLAERLGLDLSDALAGDREALADLFERVLAAVADAEPQLDDLLLARRQRFEHRFGLFLEIQVDDGFGRRDHLAILDEVAEMRIFLFADRRFEGDRLLRRSEERRVGKECRAGWSREHEIRSVGCTKELR